MEDYTWPHFVGNTTAVIHADGAVECTGCLQSLGGSRQAYKHRDVCRMPPRPPRKNSADNDENRYLSWLARVEGLSVATERGRTLFGMYRDKCHGSLLELARAKTLALRFLHARRDVADVPGGQGKGSPSPSDVKPQCIWSSCPYTRI